MGIAGLEALAKHGFDIAAVFTHEDDPDENCWFGSVKDWAVKKNITVYTTEEINEPRWITKISELTARYYIFLLLSKNDLPRDSGNPQAGRF